jgi:hypothetical protein
MLPFLLQFRHFIFGEPPMNLPDDLRRLRNFQLFHNRQRNPLYAFTHPHNALINSRSRPARIPLELMLACRQLTRKQSLDLVCITTLLLIVVGQ